MQIKSEALAYWYFRLNGFLTISDLVVHPENRRDSGTDIDVLGVRFPYRAELFSKPMQDDDFFTKITNRPYLLIAEVKKARCALNGPWIKPEKNNMLKLLRAVGAYRERTASKVAQELYEKGYFSNKSHYVSLFCVGSERNTEIREKYPVVPQITWDQILSFIYARFTNYKYEKSWHNSWDQNGRGLWEIMEQSRNVDQFIAKVEVIS